MAINCGAGWQREALDEALGRPDEDEHQPDSTRPGVRLHIIRWRCGDGYVSAMKAVHEGGYTLEVACQHRQHQDLAQLPNVRVQAVELLGPDGKALPRVPADLQGVRAKFTLTSPVRAYARLEVFPDPSTGWPKKLIEVDGGVFGPGTTKFELPLTEAEQLDDPLRQKMELSIHVLDPQTAARDRNADGICLWSADYFV
jgi:hypothetical protein